MKRAKKEYIFRCIGGVWQDVKNEGAALTGVLDEYGIIVDDRTQFARMYDYDLRVVIYYRATAGMVTITIYNM